MSEREARELLDYVELDHAPGFARVHQLGSGAWVVIIGDGDYFLWQFRDWVVFRQAEEREGAAV